MTPEQALKNLDLAVAQGTFNRETHGALIESIKILSEAIKNKE